jgi:hypothetical protein
MLLTAARTSFRERRRGVEFHGWQWSSGEADRFVLRSSLPIILTSDACRFCLVLQPLSCSMSAMSADGKSLLIHRWHCLDAHQRRDKRRSQPPVSIRCRLTDVVMHCSATHGFALHRGKPESTPVPCKEDALWCWHHQYDRSLTSPHLGVLGYRLL